MVFWLQKISALQGLCRSYSATSSGCPSGTGGMLPAPAWRVVFCKACNKKKPHSEKNEALRKEEDV